MSATVTLEEAQAKLPELVAGLGVGEELLIVHHERPVAKLVGQGITVHENPAGPVVRWGSLQS